MLKPSPLKKGDTIGIISTSTPVAALCPRRLKRGINYLESMGFKVKLGKNALKKIDYLAGTIDERVQDLHDFVRDKEVKAIINAIGGFNSNQLIEHIDYELIKNNPKIILGYSDFTAVLLSIYNKTNIVTYLGPAILPQFGEYGGVLSYTEERFTDMFIKPSHNLNIPHSKEWTSEFLEWDRNDNRKRVTVKNKGPKIIREGIMEGKILAGNMGTMLLLAGTDYMPDLTNTILFIEDDNDEKPATIDRYLFHLRMIGAFDKVKGIVIGRFHPNVNFSKERSLEDIIKSATYGYNFPIITDVDFGHTDPMNVLPNGVNASVKALGNKVEIQLKEKPTL